MTEADDRRRRRPRDEPGPLERDATERVATGQALEDRPHGGLRPATAPDEGGSGLTPASTEGDGTGLAVAEVWEALAPPERQVLVDAWATCPDPFREEELQAFLPVPGLLRRVVRFAVLAAGTSAFAAAAILTPVLLGSAALWTFPFALGFAAGLHRLQPWLTAPAGYPPGGPPDPEAMLALARKLPGHPWASLRDRLAETAEPHPPERWTASVARGRWDDGLIGYAGLRRRPPAARLALEAHTGLLFRLFARRWNRALVRRLLPDRPPPPPGLEREELAVCEACRARWHRPRPGLTGHYPRRANAPRCRRCGEQGPVLPADVRRIVAVVDGGMDGDELRGDELRLDARAHPGPFDLDAVEIGAVSDADVESLCLKAANDPDPVQRRRTARAVVRIRPGAEFAPNTVEMLERTFGTVRRDSGTG